MDKIQISRRKKFGKRVFANPDQIDLENTIVQELLKMTIKLWLKELDAYIVTEYLFTSKTFKDIGRTVGFTKSYMSHRYHYGARQMFNYRRFGGYEEQQFVDLTQAT